LPIGGGVASGSSCAATRQTGAFSAGHLLSFAELEAAFHEAVDDYLAWCAELGEEPDRPYSGKLLVRMTPDLHRSLAALAAREGISINRLVIDSLEQAVGPDVKRPRKALAPSGATQGKNRSAS